MGILFPGGFVMLPEYKKNILNVSNTFKKITIKNVNNKMGTNYKLYHNVYDSQLQTES